ncbi:MAG: hypothetical protein P4L84_29745 [Isosphaeraceae bacterium]|nr:hypothetical protein [Isosphaeraceae bacterium]
MKTQKKVRPQLEALESMALLSGAAAAVELHTHIGARVGVTRPPVLITPAPLSGSINGTFVGTEARSQSNATYRFFGVGRVNPIGYASVNGAVQVSNLVTTGSQTTATVSLNGTDTLYVHGRGGTLTLQLAGPATVTTTASSSTSSQFTFTYTVTAASGAYSGEQGETGEIDVSLRSYIPSFVHLSNFDVGRFTMSFSTASTITPV